MHKLAVSALAAMAASLSIGTAGAQDPVEASVAKTEAVRARFDEFVKARDKSQELMRPVMDDYRKAERGSEEQRKLAAKLNEIRGMVSAPQKAFEEAFVACSWSGFDPKKDAELLKQGLTHATSDLEHPEKAVEACTLFLEHFGDDRLAESVRTQRMPSALLSCGKIDQAEKLVREAAEKATGADKARLQLTLGDFAAASGDIEGAAKLYAEAESNADERTMGYVTLRKELIGKPAPNIDSSTWIGGAAKPLGDMKGKVVLVDFWATWCGPCRYVMPALSKLYEENRDKGLEVIGVTRFYANGYMPADPSQMLSGGESVQGMDQDTFLPHVTAFRKNTGISYPFVIGKEEDFQNYHVRGIPTLAVVGRDGKVALVTVGSGSEPLLRYALGNLLSEKLEK